MARTGCGVNFWYFVMTPEEILHSNETLRDKSPREVIEWAIGQTEGRAIGLEVT